MANFTIGQKAGIYVVSHQSDIQLAKALSYKIRGLMSLQSTLIVLSILLMSCQPDSSSQYNELVRQAVIRSVEGSDSNYGHMPLPKPELSPTEVVNIQLIAFKYNDEDNRGIRIAFNFFDSNSRKKHRTLEQFARLLNQPSYSLLLNFEIEKAGPVTLDGSKASQQVLLIGADGVTSRYTFQLAKQRRGKNADCWLVTAIQVNEAPAEALRFVSYTKQREHLDSLFALVRVTRSPIELKLLESLISEIWMESGVLSINKLMKIGCDAMESEDYESAIRVFDHVISRRPKFAEGWNKRATAYYLNGDFEQALADSKQTLLLEDRHFGALAGQVNIYLTLGDDIAALRGLETLLIVYPTQPGLREKINELYGRLGITRI